MRLSTPGGVRCHVVAGPDGEPVTRRCKSPEFEAAYVDQGFCAALG
jgi:hypothetical protein